MWMHAIENERQHANLLACSSDQAQAMDRAEQFRPVIQQVSFVTGRTIDSNLRDVIQGRTESNSSSNMRSTRFELVGQFVINGLLECNGTDHVAASLVRRHAFEQIFTAVQNPNARRPEHLMAGKRVEITVQGADVYVFVRYGLGAIHKHGYAPSVRHPNDFMHRHYRSKRVRDMRHSHQRGLWPKAALEILKN